MSVPDRIGRYRVDERVGSGGFGSVWRAHDAELDSAVAVKILADNWVGNADVMARFVEEARVLRRADSDRVVRVYDIGTLDDGRPYFVMSYADRGTLADRLDQGVLPVAEVLRLLGEVARGVAVLHELGFLHRDIKPSNVLFRAAAAGERTMLADLGLAKAVANASGFTVAAGTPGYMAPEQTTPGAGLDRRADVYALGALGYQMLTGQPFTATGAPDAAAPSRLRANLPAGTDELIVRALAPDREQRWSDASTFADAVDSVLGAEAGRSATPAPSAGQPPWVAGGQAPTGVTPSAPNASMSPPYHQAQGPGAPPDVTQAGGPAAWQAPAQQAFPGQPSGPPGGASPRQPGPRRRRRGPLVGLLAGGCVLVLLAAVGIYYVVTQPETVSTSRDQIVAEIPGNWMPEDGEPGETTVDLTDKGFGRIGKGIQLTTQPKPKSSLSKDVGITIVAARAFADAEASYLFDYGTPQDRWSPSECPDEAVDSKVKNSPFKRGTMRSWTLSQCAKNKTYAQAYLQNKSYGVHVFMVAEKDQRVFREVLASIQVKENALPA